MKPSYHLIEVNNYTLVLSDEPKQGYIKHLMVMRWYKYYTLDKHIIQLMRVGKNNKIMPILACASTSFLYLSLDGALI
jgi:hypothetical protein